MSSLLKRLQAMRGQAPATAPAQARPASDSDLERNAAELQARLVETKAGIHFVKDVELPADTEYGRAKPALPARYPLLLRHTGAQPGGRVLYLDTETTGLSGGTGTFAFLIGIGVHSESGFRVSQLMLPGPQHERSQLLAVSELARGASAVVTYNGGSFDLPLLRSRFALNGLADPFYGVPHLDLLTLSRRLWRSTLPDCTLGTVERHILGVSRDLTDVPGFEVPARYLAWLRTKDAGQLHGVLGHNSNDIVALSALRWHLEQLLSGGNAAAAVEQQGLGLWLERIGETDQALEWLLRAGRSRPEAAWQASLLLKRLGRHQEAVPLWLELGEQGHSAAWVELAKVQEHQQRDYVAALEYVTCAEASLDADEGALQQRRERLERRLSRHT